MASVAGAGDDNGGASGGVAEKIKNFTLAMTVSIPPKDKDKHKVQSQKLKEESDSNDAKNKKTQIGKDDSKG